MTLSFEPMDLVFGLVGGVLIGLSVTVMLLFQGRITGISGITYRFITLNKDEWSWRGAFLGGLVFGGLILSLIAPMAVENTTNRSLVELVVAGLLVGFGTVLGNGCTSGHGVCGISRMSPRSISATLVFMLFGILAVYTMRVFL